MNRSGPVQRKRHTAHLQSRQLQRSGPSPQEHPVYEHPVLAEAPQVEVSARPVVACLVVAHRKNF